MNIRQKYLLAAVLILLTFGVAVLPARPVGAAPAGATRAARSTQSQIPQRTPPSSLQVAAMVLFRDLVAHGVGFRDAAKIFLNAVNAGDEQLIAKVQKRFDRGRLDAAGVLAAFESLAANRIRPEGNSAAICGAYGDGVEYGCIGAGGDPLACQIMGDMTYCDCMGGVFDPGSDLCF